jgi:group I intron endonuclease
MVLKRKISGVYKITCTETSDCYIGQSGDITGRWNQHLEGLMSNRHVNLNLQEAWNKYSLIKFNFTVLEIVQEEKDRIEREKHFIRENLSKCYNSQWDRAHSIVRGKIIHSSSGKELNAKPVLETQPEPGSEEDLVTKWHRMVSRQIQ